jgi:hypothetical protein
VRHGLLVANMTSLAAGIDTSGDLIADVVNPSFLPDLGYAIPAGDWACSQSWTRALGQAGRTLPITVQP